MEKHIASIFIEQMIPIEHGGRCYSLDIGCATGRYPCWLASLGFFAYGYDIEDTAISICKEKSSSIDNIVFEKRNILTDKVDQEKFHLVTCMMGTFNHIPLQKHKLFLDKIHTTLKPGGILLFSSWNPSCPYMDYLEFYGRREKEYLQSNSTSSQRILNTLIKLGFKLKAIVPFIFLSNECYNSWEDELTNKKLFI